MQTSPSVPEKKISRHQTRPDKLNRWEAFAIAYVSNGCRAKKAAISAGYSEKTAPQMATKLLNETQVSLRIKELSAEKFKNAHMEADEIIHRMSVLARADVRGIYKDDGTLVKPHELDDETALCIRGVKTAHFGGVDGPLTAVVDYKIQDSMAALTSLAKIRRILDSDPTPPPPKVPTTDMERIELARRVAFMLMRATAETIEHK